MRVVYDGHIFRWQKAGGIRRYFTEIITHLPPDWTPIILGGNGDHARLPSHGRLKVSMVSSTKPRRFTQPIKRSLVEMLVTDKDALSCIRHITILREVSISLISAAPW